MCACCPLVKFTGGSLLSGVTASVVSDQIDDTKSRRNARILAIAQMLYGCHAVVIITCSGVVGLMLAENKSLATLPISMFVLGTAILTVPASLLMRRLGRRFGFMVGGAFGATSMALASISIWFASFPMFCLSLMLLGGYQASSMYYRFAAADVASERFKPKAISWVLVGGVAAAMIAPQLLIHTRNLFAPITFAGTFACLSLVSLCGMIVLSFVDIPLLPKTIRKNQGRPLAEIMSQPKFIIAVICAMVSYSMMTLLMTATPIAMLACDFSIEDAAFVVQWHAVAMFAPSFFTGNLINKFGTRTIILSGFAILAVCGVIALSGIKIEQFTIALILLGLGWNFGFVGSTNLVTETYQPEERNKVQAANDLLVFSSVAATSLMSGVLLQNFGWPVVVSALFPFIALASCLLIWSSFKHNHTVAN